MKTEILNNKFGFSMEIIKKSSSLKKSRSLHASDNLIWPKQSHNSENHLIGLAHEMVPSVYKLLRLTNPTSCFLLTLFLSFFLFACSDKDEPGLPEIITLDASMITHNSAVSGGNIIDDGGAVILSRGIVWSETMNPTIDVNKGITRYGKGRGVFENSMNSLSGNTTYFVRAYAANKVGVVYGNAVSFSTLPELLIPEAQTSMVSDITSNRAKILYHVISDGGADVFKHGICYSRTDNPTIFDNHITNGIGVGSFELEVNNLLPGSTYNVRAFAVNSIGVAYGTSISFKTDAVIPTIITLGVYEIKAHSAVGVGKVISDGGGEISFYGMVWGKSLHPVIENDSHTTESGSISEFHHTFDGLAVYESYYLRAYAINEAGISYGETLPFATKPAIGDFYQGGIVFHLNNDGGGMVCSPNDLSTNIKWGCFDTFIGQTSTALGMGASNTVAIISSCTDENNAAYQSHHYSINGYDDWHLPSKNELHLIYQNLKKPGLGDFSDAIYWSSSEINPNRSWAIGFGNGVSVEANKAAGYRVRAIRTF